MHAPVVRSVAAPQSSVGDRPVTGTLRYAGAMRAGGGIDALITLDGDVDRAVLRADLVVAVGGTCRGCSRSHG